MNHHFSIHRILGIAVGLLIAASGVHAQTVYRIVGPDGKVSFSDQPPANAANSKATNAMTGAAVAGRGNPPLSYELRQVMGKFPVTLYTGGDCSPCNSARNLLMQRGVPFTERTVNTEADSTALKQRSGDNSLPFATIGQQQLKGFSDSEWTQYLEAAGYAAGTKLPAGYRNPEPTPLVAMTKAPAAPEVDATKAAADKAEAARIRAQRAAPQDTQSNPAGIKF